MANLNKQCAALQRPQNNTCPLLLPVCGQWPRVRGGPSGRSEADAPLQIIAASGDNDDDSLIFRVWRPESNSATRLKVRDTRTTPNQGIGWATCASHSTGNEGSSSLPQLERRKTGSETVPQARVLKPSGSHVILLG